MLAFPNIKINLGLSITEKRPDGYHNLETVFYPVALEDALEIRTSSETEKKIILHQYGMEIAGNPEDNLVVKAYIYYKHNHILLLYGHYLYAFDNNQFL